MAEISAKTIQASLDDFRVWELGNKFLYELCAEYPDHKQDNVIIAKAWLIGRAYAAALERRKKVDAKGDAFYVGKLAPQIRNSEIDDWFGALRVDTAGSPTLSIKTHRNLVELLEAITGHAKRSFASKYLHFHFPEQFFIYNSRASVGLRRVMKMLGEKPSTYRQHFSDDVDKDYADFFVCCDFVSQKLSKEAGRELTKREVDTVLLAVSDGKLD